MPASYDPVPPDPNNTFPIGKSQLGDSAIRYSDVRSARDFQVPLAGET